MLPLGLVVAVLCVTSCALGIHGDAQRSLSDTSRVCLATYDKDLKNEFLHGRWYFVYNFSFWLNLPHSASCREVLFERPTQQNLTMYTDYFNLADMPYSFDEDSVTYSELNSGGGKFFDGLFLGGREAKFFLRHPSTKADRASYDLRVFRYINDDYLVHEVCDLRGHTKWLISRKKHPSDEELLQIINSQADLKALEKQKYCHLYQN